MINKIEEQKRVVKEQMNREIDKYYNKLENGSNSEIFPISKIELMLKEQMERTNNILREATNEAIDKSSTEKILKKRVS